VGVKAVWSESIDKHYNGQNEKEAKMASFEESYMGQLRLKMGPEAVLIVPSARAVIFNDQGDVLCVRRSDNGRWNLPAGSIEIGESIYDCLCREVKEECGLDVLAATPISLYTEPRFIKTNFYGNTHQMFAVAFRVDRWSGELAHETDETTDARFFPLDALPDLPRHQIETLEDMKIFDGHLIVK